MPLQKLSLRTKGHTNRVFKTCLARWYYQTQKRKPHKRTRRRPTKTTKREIQSKEEEYQTLYQIVALVGLSQNAKQSYPA